MAISIDPRTKDDIYQSLKNSLSGKISGLTNFAKTSFNYVWTQAFAEEQHKEEVAALAVQLSGWPKYSGKDITQEDLDDLGVTGATPEEVNKYIEQDHLDELAKVVGVTRGQGQPATGQVEITTSTATTVQQGTEFGTQPDSNGDFLKFETTEEVTTNSATTVTANIQAVNVGDEYNVGAGTITYLVNPSPGIDSVTNPSGTTGGTDVQSNASLRQDIQNAVIENSGGGTKAGMEAFIEDNTNAIDVVIQEKFTGDTDHGNYPHGDVIALGGTDTEVNEAIDDSHPSAVEHILVRPNLYGVNVYPNLEGNNIDASGVEDDILNYFDNQLLGDNVFRDKIIQIIMNSDTDIDNIASLDIEINEEPHVYDTDNSGGDAPNHPYYVLDKGSQMEQTTNVVKVSGTTRGSDVTYKKGVDFRVYDSTNSDFSSPGLDAIKWDVPGVSGAVADDGGTQTTETAAANDSTADDMTLLPATPAAGDAYYFAADDKFDGMELNISTAGSGTWSITWEYYDGSAWTALSNVVDDTNGFTTAGRNLITWDEPNDWATTSVNGISGVYWVRARVSSYSSVTTQPLGQQAFIGKVPDEDTTFDVTYEVDEDIPIQDREVANSGTVTVTVV